MELQGEMLESSYEEQPKYTRSDLSKSMAEFRNLEYSFMLDHGYLLFEYSPKKDDAKTIQEVLLESVKNNISDSVQIYEITHADIQNHVSGVFSKDRYGDIILFICIAVDNINITIIPGLHNKLNWIDKPSTDTENEQCFLMSYPIDMEKGNIMYIHPYIMYNSVCTTQKPDDEKLRWYAVKSTVTDTIDRPCTWRYWNVFKRNCDLTPLIELKNTDRFFDMDSRFYNDFCKLERSGLGVFVKLNADNIVFRIKPRNYVSHSCIPYDIQTDTTVPYIKLGHPSLYESTVEIVYYFDTSVRLTHSNYTDRDRFDVRTGGVLSRSCNTQFTNTLYDMCTVMNDSNEVIHVFKLEKIVEYFRSVDYNKLITQWYPYDAPEESTDGTNSNEYDDTDKPLLLTLNIKKRHTVFVYKFDVLNAKNISRIEMILSWMRELKLRGGFILSNNTSISPGYMIVSGDEIIRTHHAKLGNTAVFVDRFKCLHWRKVKHYDYMNNNAITKLNYEDLPEQPFCFDRIKIENEKTSYPVLHSIPTMF